MLQIQLRGHCSGELGEDLSPTLLPLLCYTPESIMSEGSWSQLRGTGGSSRTGWAARALASFAQHRAGTACS